MADGYALATSALLAIFCASLCNLPPHNGFLDHYYHGAQSGCQSSCQLGVQHGGWLCSSDLCSPGDILCLSVQFASSSIIITMVHNLERLLFGHEYFSERMSMLECSLSFHVVAFENLGGSSVQSFSRGVLNTTQMLLVLLIQLFI